MREQMSSFDIHRMVDELQTLVNARCKKSYQPHHEQLVLRIKPKSLPQKDLVIIRGSRLYLSSRDRPMPNQPAPFAMLLRKHLTNARIEKISQIGFDRAISIIFDAKMGKRELIIECFRNGNMILLDEKRIIIAPLTHSKVSGRIIKKGISYEPPKGTINPSDLEKKDIKEVKTTSGFIFKEILILLHPFIPFITEELWLKNKLGNKKEKYLMYVNWIKDNKARKDKEITDVNQVIDLISRIRSFKNELSVSPGSFIDISVQSVSKNKQNLFLNNEIMLKKLGRINSIFTKDSTNESATLVISGEIFKIYFDKSVDLDLIKDNLSKKHSKLSKELESISKKLDNKSFVERAPKHIVEQEKNTYNELKSDIDKINLTIKSFK